MKVIFYLKYGQKFEALGCNGEDVTRLANQFNNGHLMSAKGLYTNPKELISFVVCDEEDN